MIVTGAEPVLIPEPLVMRLFLMVPAASRIPPPKMVLSDIWQSKLSQSIPP